MSARATASASTPSAITRIPIAVPRDAAFHGVKDAVLVEHQASSRRAPAAGVAPGGKFLPSGSGGDESWSMITMHAAKHPRTIAGTVPSSLRGRTIHSRSVGPDD